MSCRINTKAGTDKNRQFPLLLCIKKGNPIAPLLDFQAYFSPPYISGQARFLSPVGFHPSVGQRSPLPETVGKWVRGL